MIPPEPLQMITNLQRLRLQTAIRDKWKISGELDVKEGSLKAVTVSPSGNIYLGGESFVSCYSGDLRQGLDS